MSQEKETTTQSRDGTPRPTSIQEKLYEANRAYRAGRLQEAIAGYQEVLELSPKEPNVLTNLAVALRATGRNDEAVNYLGRAIDLDPDNPHSHFNLGNAYRSAERLEQAVTCYSRAIELDRDYLSVYSNLALTLKDLKRFDEAIRCLAAALQRFPDDPNLYANLGVVLWGAKKTEASIAAYQRVAALSAMDAVAERRFHNDGQFFYNFGAALFKAGRFEEAIEIERKAASLKSDFAEPYAIIGQSLASMGRMEEALNAFEEALARDPENKQAHRGRTRTLLLAGNYELGFAEYEWRWARSGAVKRSFNQPEWEGDEINGRRILLYSEQGLGDTIQMARYIPLVAAKSGTVIVQCQPSLVSLIATMDGIDASIGDDDRVPAFDCHAPLFSLPRLLGTTIENIPASIPYLRVEGSTNAGSRSTDDSPLRIGIAWAGSPSHEDDANRSCDLTNFMPILSLPRTQYYSLQVGPRSADIAMNGCGAFLADLSPRIGDFTDTARIVSDLDLVICVDTAVAHLGGALGKPVWILLPFSPDWRWMLDRDDSPWYPTMRLYRQPSPGDWKSVFDDVCHDLQQLVTASSIKSDMTDATRSTKS